MFYIIFFNIFYWVRHIIPRGVMNKIPDKKNVNNNKIHDRNMTGIWQEYDRNMTGIPSNTGNKILCCTQRNHFEISLNQTEIRLY